MITTRARSGNGRLSLKSPLTRLDSALGSEEAAAALDVKPRAGARMRPGGVAEAGAEATAAGVTADAAAEAVAGVAAMLVDLSCPMLHNPSSNERDTKRVRMDGREVDHMCVNSLESQ